MNKNYKVVTINGFRGVIAVIFIVFGLISGFVVSPGWVCMKTWNYFFENSTTLATMNIYQGIMMWAIIALSLYALNNRKTVIGFNSFQGLTPDQIKDIMRRSREAELKVFKNIDLKPKDISNEKADQTTTEVEMTEEKEESRG